MDEDNPPWTANNTKMASRTYIDDSQHHGPWKNYGARNNKLPYFRKLPLVELSAVFSNTADALSNRPLSTCLPLFNLSATYQFIRHFFKSGAQWNFLKSQSTRNGKTRPVYMWHAWTAISDQSRNTTFYIARYIQYSEQYRTACGNFHFLPR